MDPFAELWGPPKSSGAGPLTTQLLKQLEGFAPVAKWDYRQHSGGYGSRAAPGERFTPELAEQRLNQDVAPVNAWLDKNVTQPLNDKQRAAFNSFGYNLGVDDLERLKPDINRGDWSTVGNRMLSFNKAGGEVNQGLINRRRQEAALVTGGQMPESNMPMMQPPQRQPGPLTSAMGGMSNSMVPGIFGGGDEPGYFGKLLSDPTFLMGASVLGSGLSGRDAGSALQQGAQGAAAVSEMTEKKRRAQAWQKTFGGGSAPDPNSPMLKGVPPDLVPLIHAMGPEQGMQLLGQIKMKQLTGRQVGVAAPGSTFYDQTTGEQIGRAPSESPYGRELAQEQAKADVKSGEHAKAGQQMLDLTDKITQLAGQPGTPARQTFEDSTGPLQGSDWYQTAKGFINSKAETPVVHAQLQQDLGTLKLLATRAYLSGQGQVTEAERAAVAEAIGRVEKAPSAEAGLQALNNVRGIIQQVFMKPPTGQPGAPAMPGAPPPQMPQDVAMPGMSVQGGVPGAQPQPAPPPAPAPQGPPEPAVQLLRQNPAPEVVQQFEAKYGPGSAQQVLQGGGAAQPPAPAAAPGPVDKGPFSAPRPNGPNVLDRWVLKAGAERKPELIQQYNAAYGPGEAEKVLAPQPPQRTGRQYPGRTR